MNWSRRGELAGQTEQPVAMVSGRMSERLHGDESMMVFAGNANRPLAEEIVARLRLPLGKAVVDHFSDGEVSVEIIDMLGRSVMTVPVKQIEAGAARTVEVNASSLASGTYLYRLIATTATDTMVKTGRMMLIK